MTVSTTLNKIVYPGTGSQTVFSFAFAFPGGTATQEAANIQVFYTDTAGNVTQLVQGPGATQYQITFNPASGTNPTPAGGTVTYNPSGTPIALGTSLTILRNLPLTQSTSLANQGTLYQPVTEAALDYEMMVSQQVLEVQSRALVVPVSDSAPAALPAAAARKNLFLAFDANGNPIASQPSGANTPVSSAMVPVVTAATLAAARTALGLGGMATEGIGQGLADDGSGNVRLSMLPVADSSPVSVVGATAFTRRILFANVTYTFPASSTLYNGFGFWIDTSAFVATLAINAADAFSGMPTGASLIEGPGQSIYVYTNAAGAWFVDKGTPISLNAPVNLQLNASVASSALTIAIKDRNGNDPSASSPVIVGFRDPTAANGDPIARAVASALSITVPNGATLGTANGQANRIWVGLFDNSGTPVLGVYNSLTLAGPSIVPWDETSVANGTAISAGATNSQVWYTNGAVTSKAFRILGYVESTQPTAGAWTAAPSKVQLFGPGVKRPGDTVQEQSTIISSADTTTSATFVALTNNRISFTPISNPNLVRLEGYGAASIPDHASGGTVTANLQFSRGVVAATGLIGIPSNLSTRSATASIGPIVWNTPTIAYDTPGGAVTYAMQANITSAATLTYGGNTMIVAREIQI